MKVKQRLWLGGGGERAVETSVSLPFRGMERGNSLGPENGECGWLSPMELNVYGVEFWAATLRSCCLSDEGRGGGVAKNGARRVRAAADTQN